MTGLNTREKTQEDETLGEELKSKAWISKIRSFDAFLFVK